MSAARIRLAGGIGVLAVLVVLAWLLPPTPDGARPARGVHVQVGGRVLQMCPVGSATATTSLTAGVRTGARGSGDASLRAGLVTRTGELSTVDLQVARPGDWDTVGLDTASRSALLIDARGPLAGGLWSQLQTVADSGENAGLQVTDCLAPQPLYRFTGLSEDTGQHATITLVNPDVASARIDLRLYGPDGQLPDPEALQQISVPGRGSRVVDLDDLAAGESALAAEVEVTSGRVGAFASQRADEGETTGGVDSLGSAAGPAGTVVIPGLGPRINTATLSVFPAGQDGGTATIEILEKNGAIRPAGHDTVQLTPGQVSEVDLTGTFEAQAAAVRVSADVDVTAGLRLASAGALSTGDRPRPVELALANDTAALSGPVVLGVPARPVTTTLQFTGTGTAAASVHVSVVGEDGDEVDSLDADVDPGATAALRLPRSAAGRAVVVTADSDDAVVGAAVFTAAGDQPLLSVLPLG